jgi:hypothetical protein
MPSTKPTWNNVVNASPSIIIPDVLGTFSDICLGVREFITWDACSYMGRDAGGVSTLAFIFEMDQSVHQSAEVKFNQTLMNADIVTGVYVNFTC